MIVLKQAPAGFIGQVFRNGIDMSDSVELTLNFMDVTGKWCPTPRLAEETCRKQLEHRKKLLRERLTRLQKELAALEEDHEVWVK